MPALANQSCGTSAGDVRALTERVAIAYSKGLSWIVSRLDLFTPSDITRPEAIKESTELALLYCFAKLWRPCLGRSHLLAVRKFLLRWLSDPLLTEWLLKSPSHYSPSAIAYLALRATNERISGFEDALRRLKSAGFPQCLEQTAYRALELEYILWKSGFTKRKPRCGAHFRASAFALMRNPIYLSDPEVYSITHTLLYLTDFAGPHQLPGEIRARGVHIVRSLLVHYRRIRDWDITGELLLNLVGLDSYDDALFTNSLCSVCAAQTGDGAVPGPTYSASDSKADTRAYIFEHCYHTTLVSMLLWAAYLHRTGAHENA
jgi:hypothetical protein